MSDGLVLSILGGIGVVLAVIEIVKGRRIDEYVAGSRIARGGPWFPTRWLGVGLLFGSLAAILAGVVVIVRGN
jgi:hypothetical protein